ncbi:MAG: FHA domain-containing protein [Deltaproteobacteria bacterium]|nr:FHA domain-containing protein [Deltaproteobacteria bacterium]
MRALPSPGEGPAPVAVPSLPAFLRVEHGLPWGHWLRLDAGSAVAGSAPGLALSLADPTLAPCHAHFHHSGERLVVEALRADAELRVDGLRRRVARIDEPCVVSLGATHLQVLPPPRSASECDAVLQILRSWMRGDPATGLPTAARLGEVLREGCREDACRQALLLVGPDRVDRAAARTLLRALPEEVLVCRVGPEQLAAWLPEGPPARLELPASWRVVLVDCAATRHRPELMLLRALETLRHRAS